MNKFRITLTLAGALLAFSPQIIIAQTDSVEKRIELYLQQNPDSVDSRYLNQFLDALKLGDLSSIFPEFKKENKDGKSDSEESKKSETDLEKEKEDKTKEEKNDKEK